MINYSEIKGKISSQSILLQAILTWILPPVIIIELAAAGVDMIEIGIPFSDPMADGPVIQNSNSVALKNGMSLKLLFRQLMNIRNHVDIPLMLMSYCNPILSYGMEKFCSSCNSAGIDGVIIPDLPPEILYRKLQIAFCVPRNLSNILMIAPQTDPAPDQGD